MAYLDAAYSRFFRNKTGFPKFKSKRDKKSYSTNSGLRVGESFIRLPRIGNVPAVISRPIVGRIVKATVTQKASGKYFVSILCETNEEKQKKIPVTNPGTLGIDLGISHFCTTSTGEKVENPRYLKKALAKLRRAQRKLARKTKGSKNRRKQQRTVARIHEKVANQRKDFHHKLSTRLVSDNQTNAVALETLSVAGLQKNRRLARAVGDAGWAAFISMLEYKTEKLGKSVLRIGRFEPSSKLCTCGEINNSLKLSDRVWVCSSCKQKHDRDMLAAQNIKRMALHPKYLIPQEVREYTLEEIGQ